MKNNFWLILAVLSLLGMLIMPGTAHSAVIAVPTALPISAPSRIVLPNYPLPRVSIHQPRIQLPTPQLQPGLIPVSLPSVAAVAPAVLVPVVTAQAPAVVPPGAPLISAPQSAIPSSRIAGISAPRKTRKSAGGILVRMGEKKEGGLPSARKIAAMFDGLRTQEPAPVPVGPAQSAPADSFEDNSLTLPESDLAEEIGLGY
jgi:hypothetical protein